MSTENSDNSMVCSHCGVENERIADTWLEAMNDKDALLCSNCSNPLSVDLKHDNSDAKQPDDQSYLLKLLIIFAVVAGILLFLNQTFNVLSFKEDYGQIFYGTFVVLIISAILAAGKIWQKLKYLSLWLGIFTVLLVGYSYRHELSAVKQKVLAELVPAKGFQKNPQSVSFPLSSDGHFYIRAQVNGVPITFLADTGASHIVLSPHDAAKIGLEPDKLGFDRLYETANGTVRGSSIRISQLIIADIQLKEIGASVNEVAMQNSLLGMTFFKQFESYVVKDNILTLNWRP